MQLAGLTGNETVLDLYCGTGTITLCLARHAKKAIGVEIVPQAIEDAKFNAAQNGMENAEFFCMDAGQAAKMLADRHTRPDVIRPGAVYLAAVLAGHAQKGPACIRYLRTRCTRFG